jgi:hypothetical protein
MMIMLAVRVASMFWAIVTFFASTVFSVPALLRMHAKEVVASESDAQDEQDDTCNQAAFPRQGLKTPLAKADLLTDQHSCGCIRLF